MEVLRGVNAMTQLRKTHETRVLCMGYYCRRKRVRTQGMRGFSSKKRANELDRLAGVRRGIYRWDLRRVHQFISSSSSFSFSILPPSSTVEITQRFFVRPRPGRPFSKTPRTSNFLVQRTNKVSSPPQNHTPPASHIFLNIPPIPIRSYIQQPSLPQSTKPSQPCHPNTSTSCNRHRC